MGAAILHPSDQTLHAYALGTLDDVAADSVGSHLEECPDCRRRVSEVSGDSFLGRLRDARPQPGSSLTEGRSVGASKGAVSRPAVATPDEAVPRELAEHPQYEIKKELGRGGMGVVYLAHNRDMDRLEVLKILNQELLARRGALLERFLREIRTAGKLNHPNVVHAYSTFEVGRLRVFAMEYVEGEDLAGLVKKRGPLPVNLSCHFITQAALGMQHAHEAGMVHRDIKPGNLMVARQGQKLVVKVLDFGLAKALREAPVDGAKTQEGQALGTPDYNAPEQILNASKADIRADIYSLGCTLYYLLTGKPPFQGDSLYDVYQAHISTDAKPLNLIRPEVPVELAAVVGKMMAKDPDRRYQTPAEVAEALKPFWKPGAAVAPPPVASQSVVDPSMAPAPTARAPRPAPAAPQAEERWASLIDISERDHSKESKPASALTAPAGRQPPWLWAALAGGVLLFGFLIAWMIALSVKTKDGVLVFEGLPADADVYMDGEKVAVSWPGGGKPAEFSTRPGQHGVEVKKDGIRMFGNEVTVESGGRSPIVVHFDPKPFDFADRGASSPAVGPRAGEKLLGKPVPLFNGRDFTGWIRVPWGPPGSLAMDWIVEDGAIRTHSSGRIYTERDDYENFRLVADLKVDANYFGNIWFRSGVSYRGENTYGVVINTQEEHQDWGVSGSIIRQILGDATRTVVAATEGRVRPGTWFTLELTARGNRFVVKIDGQEVSAGEDDTHRWTRGAIAIHRDWRSGPGALSCRRIEIDELPPEKPGETATGWQGAVASIHSGSRYRLMNVKTGLALGVLDGAREKASPQILTKPGDDEAQEWIFSKRPNDECQIINRLTACAIDVPNNVYENGLALQVWGTAYDNLAQVWRIVPHAGSLQLLSHRGLAITVGDQQGAGAPVLQMVATGRDEELWRLEPLGWITVDGKVRLPDVNRKPQEVNPPVPLPGPGRMAEGTRADEERDDNALNLKLCWCPPGSFRMGSPESEPDRSDNEGPVNVTLSRGFWLGKFEVTQSQWQTIMGTTVPEQMEKSQFKSLGLRGEGPDYPMYYVSHREAEEFCIKFTESEHGAGRLPLGWEYRLPTEAQWEYACRAGTTTATAFGDQLSSVDANCNGRTPYNGAAKGPHLDKTSPVGQYRPNAWGIYDMHGNIYEWCRDGYAEELAGGVDPLGPSVALYRVGRGGGWFNDGGYCRSADRRWRDPGHSDSNLGFRVARVPTCSPASPSSKAVAPTQLIPSTLAFEGKSAGEERDDNALKMKLCWCPLGSFRMGSPADEPVRSGNEGLVNVTLSRGFWLGRFEVTQSQWRTVMGTAIEDKAGGRGLHGAGPDHPMYYVSHTEAEEYCAKFTASEHRAGRLPSGWEYRIPTEAQWEYACRAGTTAATAFGDKLSSADANFNGNNPYNGAAKGPYLEKATPVGQYRPNKWGFYDMHGNVWEWCRDCYATQLAGGVDPLGPVGDSHRVRHGGGWNDNGRDCRSANRGAEVAGDRFFNIGFRVALVPSGPPSSPPPNAATPSPSTPVPSAAEGTTAGAKRDDNALNLKLCWCPPGSFRMGSPESEPDREKDESPVDVTLSRGFWMGKFEVTQAQWHTVMGSTIKSHRKK